MPPRRLPVPEVGARVFVTRSLFTEGLCWPLCDFDGNTVDAQEPVLAVVVAAGDDECTLVLGKPVQTKQNLATKLVPTFEVVTVSSTRFDVSSESDDEQETLSEEEGSNGEEEAASQPPPGKAARSRNAGRDQPTQADRETEEVDSWQDEDYKGGLRFRKEFPLVSKPSLPEGAKEAIAVPGSKTFSCCSSHTACCILCVRTPTCTPSTRWSRNIRTRLPSSTFRRQSCSAKSECD